MHVCMYSFQIDASETIQLDKYIFIFTFIFYFIFVVLSAIHVFQTHLSISGNKIDFVKVFIHAFALFLCMRHYYLCSIRTGSQWPVNINILFYVDRALYITNIQIYGHTYIWIEMQMLSGTTGVVYARAANGRST